MISSKKLKNDPTSFEHLFVCDFLYNIIRTVVQRLLKDLMFHKLANLLRKIGLSVL